MIKIKWEHEHIDISGITQMVLLEIYDRLDDYLSFGLPISEMWSFYWNGI